MKILHDKTHIHNLRDDALEIYHAALAAADPHAAVLRVMHREGERLFVQDREYDLSRYRRALVIGFGKASPAMARAVEEIIGDRVERGLVITKYEHTAPLEKIDLHHAGHPLLDEAGLRGTHKLLELVDTATVDDLVIGIISGGGSALLELPVDGISLADLRAMTSVLLRAGVPINELNTIRKHISQVKGGQLARRAGQAQIISLILSDVIGSPLDTIASGPTAPDPTTYADALSIIDRRGLRTQLPASIIEHLQAGAGEEIPDTPYADDPMFARVQNVLVADNAIACDAAVEKAQALGYNTLMLTTYLQGETRDVAQAFVAIAKEIAKANRPVARPACVIASGETTVFVRGIGKGGRNQEFALASAIEIAGMRNVVVLSCGTDGADGPTDATGAIVDGATVARATELGLVPRAFLANNDSYHFFKPLGDLIFTGPTGTNVNDIVVVLVQ